MRFLSDRGHKKKKGKKIKKEEKKRVQAKIDIKDARFDRRKKIEQNLKTI